MNLPKLQLKYYLLAGLVVVALIYSQREGLTDFVDGIVLFATQNWIATAVLVSFIVIAWWLSQQWRGKLIAEMPPAAVVLRWCCYYNPDFIMKRISEDDIEGEHCEPLIMNNRLVVSFRRTSSGQEHTFRIDMSPKYTYKVTYYIPQWLSLEQREKLCRPEMLYEAAKMTVKETEEAFQEKKDEV